MQIVYKFRVHFEDHDDIVRFIDIDSTSSFSDFHKIIQESVGFDASKTYIFHMSNDFWRTEEKICDSESKGEAGSRIPSKTILNRFINDPHQRFIYSFDPELEWTFHIELVKIQKAEPNKKYPLLARKEGEAPKQYKLKGKQPGATANLTDYDKMSDMLIASRLMDDLIKSDDEDLDEEEIPDELDLDEPASLPAEVLKTKAPKEKLVIDLKFDDEELKVDADDLDFLEGEEGDEEAEDEDDFESSYGDSDENDDY